MRFTINLIGVSHTWEKRGSYEIKVKAKDVNGAESQWSDPLSVTMPRSKVSNKNLIDVLTSIINQGKINLFNFLLTVIDILEKDLK